MNPPASPEPPVPADLPVDPGETYDPGLTSDLSVNSIRNQFLETVVLGSDAIPQAENRGSTDREGRRRAATVPAIGGAVPDFSPSVPRFLLNRKIGEGGFGEVWEAHQTSLSRPIAVKRLKHNSGTVDTGVFTGDLRQAEIRFRQEALTTAHLEHPNIVPVHDLGVDADGRPLLAMKLVNGREWRASLAEDFVRLPVDEYLAKHLLILISVTQAVAFAHSRGIVHRDLKPAQVMIGAFGEVLLMDWGLAMAWPLPNLTPAGAASDTAPGAQPVNPSLAATSPLYHPLNPAGTVAYMAPEQTEDTPANLGPWTDVWLLGAILYEILTGTPPYTGASSAATFRMAKEANVTPPSERTPRREVPRQLATLAMRAMARNPAERIPSAQAFLEAVQNYLTGADKRRESREMTDRAWDRFQTAGDDYGRLAECLNDLDRALILWPGNAAAQELRERALTQYAQAALLQNDLRLAQVQAERLDPGPTRTALLEELAVRQEVRRIEKARYADALRQAKADRERAEGLVRFMLEDLHTALKSIGRLDIIRTVTQHVHGYFDSLADSEVTDQTLQNRSVAYMNIGDLLSDEGKKPEAQDSYFKARDLAAQLVGRDPQNARYQLNLADAHERCGRIHYFQGRAEEAEREHQIAFRLRSELAERFPLPEGAPGGGEGRGAPDPQTLRVHAALASSRHDLGIVAWRRQSLETALDLHLTALRDLRRLAELAGPVDPRQPVRAVAGPPNFDHAIAWVLSTLGNVYRDLGQLDQAVEVTREGLAIRAMLSEAQPANASRLEDLMWTRSNLALMLLLRGDLEESLALFSEDIELRRRLSIEDPENVVRLGALIFPLAIIGEIRFMLGQVDEAESAVRECLDVSRTLLSRDPTSTWAMGGYAIQASQLSEILLTRHRWKEASPLIQLGLARARQVIALAPHNATYQLALARNLALYGRLIVYEVESDRGDEGTFQPTPEAVACWQEALHTISGIKAAGEQLSILDVRTQLLYLLGRSEEAAPLLERLRERRWVSPYLSRLVDDTAGSGARALS